ncbi:AraC family transcriptional regulator [Chryseobacterium arthrosphaerae]|uniref:AraC family transcriptional regulator n=1 Tax=Chryseobacterium arthrosphaerae TaxID=651561 RepID=UPI0023E237BD|nr:AraC family transcriptional regulator [Chryseobacterium arthrosphaerae]WES96184.1 AraC family transcriptional regulator [Chryseobacterium arthrosphaerae]
MKEHPNNRMIFSSEDIEIVMQNDPDDGYLLRSSRIERKPGFMLLFLLSSDIHIETRDFSRQFLIRKNQYILHFSPEETTTELWTANQSPLKYLQIHLSYSFVLKLINPELNYENAEVLKSMVQNNFIFLHKETPPDMTVEMHLILNEILNPAKKGILQKLLIEAKIIKLLILIFEQFNEKNTLEVISETPEMIRKFIDENYHRNITAEEIGKRLGMNENNIRKEFKAQYHITIAHYISELRMMKAKKMITDKDVMIKEIAIECGYEYLQNFTRAFKKKFGISPENLRNNK